MTVSDVTMTSQNVDSGPKMAVFQVFQGRDCPLNSEEGYHRCGVIATTSTIDTDKMLVVKTRHSDVTVTSQKPKMGKKALN